MAKNNNQASSLDELEAKMEQEQQQEQQEQTNSPEPTNNNPEPEQEQKESSYKPDDKEKHLYHVELEKPIFSSSNGERLSTPFIQKFTKDEYKKFVGKKNEKDKSNAEMLGYTVKVLFDPEKNLYY